jgi:hypothetical protein
MMSPQASFERFGLFLRTLTLVLIRCLDTSATSFLSLLFAAAQVLSELAYCDNIFDSFAAALLTTY